MSTVREDRASGASVQLRNDLLGNPADLLNPDSSDLVVLRLEVTSNSEIKVGLADSSEGPQLRLQSHDSTALRVYDYEAW